MYLPSHISAWVSSAFSGFLVSPKNIGRYFGATGLSL